MTALATSPVIDGQLDLLSEIAAPVMPLESLRANDFRDAVMAVADPDGWVNPNHVSAHLHRRFGEIDARWYSAMWAGSCGTKNGYMTTHREVLVPIDPTHSKGNGNKSVPMRRLRVAS